MAVDLPSELFIEVLSRLPSKSLLRCRSVCKSWLSLISSIEFRHMHLHNFNQVNPRNLIRFYNRKQKTDVYTVCYDDDHVTPDLAGALIEFHLFGYDYTSFDFTMIGCCNGVICLSDSSLDFRGNQIILWNPSIRKKLTLNLPILDDEYLLLGFGYDRISDDYKVVKLDINEDSSARPQVEVYTVKTAIWRSVRCITDFPCQLFEQSKVFYNGSVHWMVTDTTPGISRYYVLTFDISTELFGEISLPSDLMEEFRDIVSEDSLAVIGGSLAVIYSNVHSLTQVESSRYIIWATKEYKNPASWTMIYDMQYSNEGYRCVLEVRNNGDMLMESEADEYVTLCVYNSSRKNIITDSIFVDRYQESLALLDVGYNDETENLERRVEE